MTIQQTGTNYRSMHALVALSNKQLGETLWHYLKEFGAGMVQLVARPEDAVRRMHEFTFTHFFIDYDLGDTGGADCRLTHKVRQLTHKVRLSDT